ncbi:MAG: ABC transporter permease [Parvularculales bacterium]
MKPATLFIRLTILTGGLLGLWALIVYLTDAPPYILPSPLSVVRAWWVYRSGLLENAGITAVEIISGLILGSLLGLLCALVMISLRSARRWLLPLLVISQAIPVFALAPVLVLWLGYGMASKIAMAVLIIFFPVAASFYDGLRRTETGWLDMAHVMTGGQRFRLQRILWFIRIPAALPPMASGLRVATAVAPIGAVVGEWVGSSAGLGYMMLHASGRAQADVMFAALLSLVVMAVGLYSLVDIVLRRALPWQADTLKLQEDIL